MSLNVAREVALLQRLTVPELRNRYAEVFGEITNANNRPWLIKKIIWRLQAHFEGGLSEKGRQQALELANDDPQICSVRHPARSAPQRGVEPASFRPVVGPRGHRQQTEFWKQEPT